MNSEWPTRDSEIDDLVDTGRDVDEIRATALAGGLTRPPDPFTVEDRVRDYDGVEGYDLVVTLGPKSATVSVPSDVDPGDLDPLDLLAQVLHHAVEATCAIVDEHEGNFRTNVEAVARLAVRLLDYTRRI